MGKYDFDSMGALWADQARQITEKGEFVAHSGNWDLWSYSGTVYSIPVMGSGCGASVWSFVRIAAASVPLAHRMRLYEFGSVILAERKHGIFARSWYRVGEYRRLHAAFFPYLRRCADLSGILTSYV